MIAQPRAGTDTALMILDPDHTDLVKELDRTFTGWARSEGTREICPPPIYEIADLDKFDVYKNFPHLSLVTSGLNVENEARLPVDGEFGTEDMVSAQFGLPAATCYGAYLFYENSVLPQDTTVTLVNRCFRNEQKYDGLRRLMSFQMREIVALGSFEHTQRLLSRFSARITAFAGELGLTLDKLPASDPFFERDGARALMQKLSPVKHEFQSDGLAISSVNTHRNFFGERCHITLPDDGGFAFTSCVAFGLERWVSVLAEHHRGDVATALQAVRDAAARIS